MSASGTAIEHEGGKPLRSSIDSRGEAGRPRSYDCNIVDAIGADGSDQADTPSELVYTRLDFCDEGGAGILFAGVNRTGRRPDTLIDQPWKIMSIALRDWASISQSF